MSFSIELEQIKNDGITQTHGQHQQGLNARATSCKARFGKMRKDEERRRQAICVHALAHTHAHVHTW
jgi:hypothetical protein